MSRYCAFFGSINVGGNRVTMVDLRGAFAREGFENVETVVASGNVLFDFAERPSDGLEDMLAHVMLDRFQIKSFAAVRSSEEVSAAIEDNPFVGDGNENRVHTLFLAGQPTRAQFDQLLADHAGRGTELIALGDRALYVDFADGVADSKLTSAFIERRLGCRGTARNIRSLRRILAKMEPA